MTRNIAFLLIIILILTSTPAIAQSWWWNKKKETNTTQDKPSLFNRQKTTPQKQRRSNTGATTIQQDIARYQSSMASFEKLDSVVASARAANLKGAQSYARKQQSKIAREEKIRKTNRAKRIEKENAALLEAQNTQANTTKGIAPPQTKMKKKKYIYKQKAKSKNKKPPRVFNTID